jgi:hypothetical protein
VNEHLQQRILRRLESLDDERGYQVLDYLEFLESKYATRARGGGFIARITETAEDTMRAAGMPLKAITGTMGLMESAGKVMRGVAAAAQSVVDEAVKAAGPPPSPPRPPTDPAASLPRTADRAPPPPAPTGRPATPPQPTEEGGKDGGDRSGLP